MLQTGERVARRHGISTAEQNAVTLRRYEQYAQACADERAFQRRYMTLPFELPDAVFAKTVGALQGDEGIHATTAEGLARLTPVLPDGSITYGGQTHPADGNAGMLMTTAARARELSRRPEIGVEVLAFGQSRTETGYMPQAPSRPPGARWTGPDSSPPSCTRSRPTTPSWCPTSRWPAPPAWTSWR